MDFQDPSLLDQESQKFKDESVVTGPQTESDDQVTNDLKNPWSIPFETQQQQQQQQQQQPQHIESRSYATQSYLDVRFKPCLEPLEPPPVETIRLAQLQLNSSDLSTGSQACQSPKEFCPLGPRDEGRDLSPLFSSSLADAKTSSSKTKKCVSPTRNTRSSVSGSGTQPKRRRPRKKHDQSTSARYSHSIAERRYRDDLNGKIMQLHQALVAAEVKQTSSASQSNASSPDSNLSGRVRKPDIMSRAISYVHQAEVDIRHLDDEIKRLQDQVYIFQKLADCDGCSLLKDEAVQE